MVKLKSFILICCFMPLCYLAQTVTNIKAMQDGQNIIVSYNLQTPEPCTINLFVSTNNGNTWQGPLKQVQGQVGPNVKSGNNSITFFVLNEFNELRGENIKFKIDITQNLILGENGIKVEWVNIPTGYFIMGSFDEIDRNNDETAHKVTVSGFKMSKYEITFDQYDAFCDATGHQKPNDNGWGRGKHPVINVSWNDANAFAVWMGCRLPTEAEWEYACRAGSQKPFNTGNNVTTLQANYNGNVPYNNNPKGVERKKTIESGNFAPNAWGLYDMHGNVFEWCSDWYGDYPTTKEINPKGPKEGTDKVLRGGSYMDDANFCRSAFRNYHYPFNRNDNIGIRIVSSK